MASWPDRSAVVTLADDLTGALEVGAQFAAHGIPSRVTFSPAGSEGFLNVIDMESRHQTPVDTERLVTSLVAEGTRLVYLKTDSTLRGNIAPALRALHRVFPDSPIAYIPAYPSLGRTVKGGCLFVDGVPVHQTGFSRDPLNPVLDSSIPKLVGPGLPCVIHDGETNDDVAAAVAVALGNDQCRIIAGPASVAAELAGRFGGPEQSPIHWPPVRSCLIVNGSLHEASARQVEYAAARCPQWEIFRPAVEGLAVVRRLDAHPVDALMIFGGDTAYAILKELRCAWVEPLGEVIPGVPVARVPGRKLHLITKAGGFGDETLICRVEKILHAKH